MIKLLKNLYQRITATFSRHRWELKSIKNLDYLVKKEFYIFYLIRFYLKLPIHYPFPTDRGNQFFYLWDLVAFAPSLKRLSQFDQRLKEMIGEFYIKGVRAWEYGKFLSLVELDSHPMILDVGPGSSTFSYYLAHEGARVTTIDLPSPMEARWDYKSKRSNVKNVHGTVLALPFSDNSFNLVMAISTIEHLDTNYPQNKQVTYDVFIRRTKRAIKEMIRVLKKGGKLYITTDAYLTKQKTDRWKTDVKYRGIGGAFKFADIRNVLLNTAVRNGCRPVYNTSFSSSKLLDSVHYANYRGRYITTVALFCNKVV
ncbi:MAG: class I SAM-dependent methyltransferase [Candidatus Chisholmbacteria bacterium]|nr:class I SAM-dependent methyltransferase [Candidatus Chisholmbacteria bacterium]